MVSTYLYIYIYIFVWTRQRQMRRILKKICTSPRTRLAQRLCWSTCPSDFLSLLPCRMDGNAGSCLGRPGPDRVLLCCSIYSFILVGCMPFWWSQNRSAINEWARISLPQSRLDLPKVKMGTTQRPGRFTLPSKHSFIFAGCAVCHLSGQGVGGRPRSQDRNGASKKHSFTVSHSSDFIYTHKRN